ncbi:hypothetical protein K440DRAFT_633241 [Wilcoxina mikolae CBS 423.85]|nr:hypothetical protein K440DRAFT_633241 [Wilcoxina mikolae CBS 423.85]
MAIQQRCTACSTSFLKSFEVVCGARIRSYVAPTSCMPLALLVRNVYCARGQLDFAPGSKSRSTMLGEASKADEIPWYLRVVTPKARRYLPAEMQTLPELPRNPPVELADMLNQLSEVHGITNLNIIDLRPLDPPPAIGTNVLMLVGSARSVRHLHATADKVCRYMRAQYKWPANADGLLGRNQLKLINRRKQRRGKVVSTQMGEIEEVGSSDWVCVHGGNHRLVVQLLTRTKREDIAIDGLWCGILERDERHRIADAGRKAERERKWEEADSSEENTVRSTQKKEMVNVVLVNKGYGTDDGGCGNNCSDPQGN